MGGRERPRKNAIPGAASRRTTPPPSHLASAEASKECTRKEPALVLTSSSSSLLFYLSSVSSSSLEAKTNFHGNGRNQFGVRQREKTRASALCGAAEKGQSLAAELAERGRKWFNMGEASIHPSIRSVGIQSEWACVQNCSALHDDYYAAKIHRGSERTNERTSMCDNVVRLSLTQPVRREKESTRLLNR